MISFGRCHRYLAFVNYFHFFQNYSFFILTFFLKGCIFLTRCVWYNCAESTNFIVFVTLNVQEEYQRWPCTGILKPLGCWRWRQFIQSEHWEPTTQQHGTISQKNCGHSHTAVKISSPAHLKCWLIITTIFKYRVKRVYVMYICYTYQTKKRGPSSCVVGNQVQFVVYRWFVGTFRGQLLKKWTAEWKKKM